MTKFATLLAFAAVAIAPVAAHAETPKRSFEHQGVRYEYAITQIGDRKILTGLADGKEPFRLVVSGKRVNGTVNGRPVSFARAEGSEAATLAAR